jgi:hypothetical protein
MKKYYIFLILLISFVIVTSGIFAQSDLSPKLKGQLETKVKPKSQAIVTTANKKSYSSQVIKPNSLYKGIIYEQGIEKPPLKKSSVKDLVQVYPLAGDYNTGTCNASAFTETSIMNGAEYQTGFGKFDISVIPVGSVITSIDFNGYVNATNFPYWAITSLPYDPLVASAAEINAWISTNYAQDVAYSYNLESSTFTTGWITRTLGTTAIADMQASLAQGWFAIGVTDFDFSTSYYITFDGWNETNIPYLEVDYFIPEFGSLNGTVTKLTGGDPIEGVTISAVGPYNTYTMLTLSDGTYSFDPVQVGDYDITASITGYNVITVNDIVVSAGSTATQDFAMTAPTMDITPASIDVVVDPFGTATEYVTIENNGDGLLGWNAQVELISDNKGSGNGLKGSTAYGFDVNNYLYVSFDVDVPGTFETSISTSLQPFGADFDNVHTDFFYVMNYPDNGLYTVDVASGASTFIGTLTGMTAGQSMAGMACDKTTGIMYISTTSISASDIYTVDLTTGALTLIGTTGIPGLIEIAIDGTGTMYGWDIVSDVSYIIDKSTGASTLLGPLGYDLNYAQGGNWDPVADVIYLAAYTTGGNLMTLDKTTGALTLIGPLSGSAEIDGLAFPGAAENWIAIDPHAGNVDAGSSGQMAVNFDALDIIAGTVKTANIHFTSNPNVGTVTIPVTMTVGSLQFGHITGTIILGGSLPYNIGDVTQLLVQAGPYSAFPDVTGYYDITAYPGTYDVVATLYGYETQTLPGVVVPEGITVPNIDFNMPCLYGIVTGTITSITTGLSIENATVKVLGTTFQDLTGPDGVYEIIVEAGNYDVKVNCVGYASQTAPVVIGAESTITQNFDLADLEGIIYVCDLDVTPNGQMLADIIQSFFPGGLVVYETSLTENPLTEEVQSLFLLLGIYVNNYVLTESDAAIITTWIDTYDNRNIYMEGGDTWAFDTQTTLHTYFSLTGVADGSADLYQVDGIGSYWSGNSWSYSGENNYIDHLEAISPAVNVMANSAVGYNCGVAYDAGTYKSVGASFEITGLSGGPGFNMAVADVMAWFGYPVFTYGTLTGTVAELGTGNPIADADINVGGITSTVTLGDGTYYIEDVLVGTWLVNCTKEGYNPASSTVTIVEDQTTTQDFQLTAPQMVVNPLAVNVELEPNATMDDYVNISNPGNGTLDWTAGVIVTGDGGGSDALFDLQFDWPVGNASGEAGIETDGDFVYTTLWNGTQFCRYDMSGNYLGTFSCGSAGAVRDLAYNGTYFYGGAAATTVFEMDFTNEVLVSTFTAPVAIRAIAYNEDEDVFYGNNWSEDITKFNSSGANLGSFPIGPVGLDYYGFAYDNYSPGAPFLWGYAQTGNTLNELVQIQLPSGVETGLSFDVGTVAAVGTGIAGGLAIADVFVPGLYTLLGTAQNIDIWGLELCESGPVWLTIDPTSGTLAGGANEDMTLNFNALDLLPGYYNAEIHFNTTPNVGSPVVDVELHVAGLIPATNLDVTYNCTDVMLAWEMPTGGTPDSWNVYKDGSLLANSTVMTFTDAIVDPEIEYGYYIKAVYAGEESQPTPTETITVPTPGDLVPLNPEATYVGNGNVDIAWEAPEGCLAADSYNIYRDGSLVGSSATTEYSDTDLPNGFYEYFIRAVYYFGESGNSDPAYVLVGINELQAGDFEIFPNPASQKVTVNSAIIIKNIRVLNNFGQQILDKEVNNTHFEINVSQYKPGIYFIKIETGDGLTVKKMTIN